MHLIWLLLLVVGCLAPATPPDVTVTPDGFLVHSEVGITRVLVRDPHGVPFAPQQPPAPVSDVEVRAQIADVGAYTVDVHTTDGVHTVSVMVDALAGPVSVSVDAPVGQGARVVSDGDVLSFPLIDATPVQASVVVSAQQTGHMSVLINHQVVAEQHMQAGTRLPVQVTLDEAVTVEVHVDSVSVTSFALQPAAMSLQQAQAMLEVVSVDFPADATGALDLGRPVGRVTLPSAWWQQLLRGAGLGFRPPDRFSPWGWIGVVLHNHGELDLSVAVHSRVLDANDQPAQAFRPRMRDGVAVDGQVVVLGRVPAGQQARLALPLYIDDALLGADVVASQSWVRALSVSVMGAERMLVEQRDPLYVSRGSSAASIGFGLTVLGSVLGGLLLVVQGPRWLREAPTSALTTIALFGALNFLVSAVGRLLGVGVSAVLGPFAILLTGLVDDAIRYALLATLITLLPRPGTIALAALLSWLLSGVALGSLSPLDLIFVSNRVLWLEGALWLVGITRGTGWLREAPAWQWLRLSLGFGMASVATTATGIVLHAVLYRLFFATWYIAMLLIGPGFLYVLFACGFAVPFAASLRRIQR